MLPGKKYTPEDFLRIAWIRKWFVVIPTLVIAAATFGWSYTLPNRYRATTTVMVIPQRVPESYVRSTVTANVSERLQTISQQILSRTRLERIIEEFKLYQEERQTLIMEDVVEQMRVDLKLNIASPRRNEDASSFTISFESDEPRTAMLVAERLASMFVQENLQDREVLADSTNQFLQAQLEDARRKLVEREQKLEEFRRRNSGRLPSQMESNLQVMQTTQLQLQANADGVDRDRDRLLSLEASMAEPQRPEPAPRAENGNEVPAGTAAQRLEVAKESLRALELRLRPEHPDMMRAKRIIAELETKAEAEAVAVSVSPESATPALSGVSAQFATRLSEMRREAQEIRLRLEARKREEERLTGVMAAYTARLETAPTLESELTALMRDYSTIQEQYTTLLRKSEESKISVNLERRQIGERFKVLDGARLPERPISPDRARINLMGLAGGLGLGLALVAFLAYRDTTIKTDEDVVISLALPVLAIIPAMITTADRRRRRRRTALALSASVASAVLVAVIVAWRLQLIQDWVR